MKLFSRSSAEGPGKEKGPDGSAGAERRSPAASCCLFWRLRGGVQRLPGIGVHSAPRGPAGPCTSRSSRPGSLTRGPTRATRGAGGTLTAGRILQVQVTGIGSVSAGDLVPLGAFAVVVNITAVNPTASGYLTAYAAGQTLPLASTVNFIAGPDHRQ